MLMKTIVSYCEYEHYYQGKFEFKTEGITEGLQQCWIIPILNLIMVNPKNFLHVCKIKSTTISLGFTSNAQTSVHFAPQQVRDIL